MSPVTGISSWYFSWTSVDPHRPGFKLHIAVLSVLCVMFQVQLSFVVNLSSVFLVQFPNFSLSFSLLFQWLQLLLVQSYISGSTLAASLYTNSCTLTSFPLPFAQHFCLLVLPHLSVCKFSIFFVFNYYIWLICCKFSVCVYWLLLFTAIVLSLDGSSPYTSTDKTQMKQHKTSANNKKHKNTSAHITKTPKH